MTFSVGQRVEYFQREPRKLVAKQGVVEKVHLNGGEDFVQYDVLFDDEGIGLKLIHWTNLRVLDESTRAGDEAAVYMATVDEPDVEPLADWELELADPFGHKVRQLFDEAADLLLRKHRDYGPGNIAGAPGGALNGLRVRLYDKLARLNNLLDQDREPEFETLVDTLMDIGNYGLIGVLVERGDWPTLERDPR